jgi:hypothetical protein
MPFEILFTSHIQIMKCGKPPKRIATKESEITWKAYCDVYDKYHDQARFFNFALACYKQINHQPNQTAIINIQNAIDSLHRKREKEVEPLNVLNRQLKEDISQLYRKMDRITRDNPGISGERTNPIEE